MSSNKHREAVLERLGTLREEYETAAQLHEYVRSGHATRPSTEAFLTVCRLDTDLALEVRGSMGRDVHESDSSRAARENAKRSRDVICALADDHGVVRYPLYSHSAVAAKTGVGDVTTQSVERYRAAADALEARRPHVVMRDATELHGWEAPESWQAIDGPGTLWEGP